MPNLPDLMPPRPPRTTGDLRTRAVAALVLFALLGGGAAARAAPPHQHGLAGLDAAVDGSVLTISLNLPLDSLLGFERAPRTAAEKQAVAQLTERLSRPQDVVRPDAAAQCEGIDQLLVSGALGLGLPDTARAGSPPTADEHGDLDATYTFRCREVGKLAFVDLTFMKAYPRIERVEAQVVASKGQGKQVIKRPAQRLAWPAQ